MDFQRQMTSPALQMGLEDFENYKDFFRHQIAASAHIRGYQTLLAKAMGVHPSFVSQLLSGSVQLTPDHAAKLAEFWLLDSVETDIFLNLVHLDRAGSQALRKLTQAKLKELRERKRDLGERFGAPKLTEAEKESRYYSHWLGAAVHVLCSIPKYQTPETLASRLNLPVANVLATLKELEDIGLVRQEKGKWQLKNNSLHVSKSSPLLRQHLINWRYRAVLSAQIPQEENVHYSAVHALSKKDIEKLRLIIINFLEQTRRVVAPSPEEEAVCLNLDFFTV